MKLSEATNHAIGLITILEENKATADDMVLVAKIVTDLAKAQKVAELQKKMSAGMEKAFAGKLKKEVEKGVLKRSERKQGGMANPFVIKPMKRELN